VTCVHAGQCLAFWRKRGIWQACQSKPVWVGSPLNQKSHFRLDSGALKRLSCSQR
jgi:hypothetical protein